jgi:murein L,D-transpeptidase YcbB/YkuD
MMKNLFLLLILFCPSVAHAETHIAVDRAEHTLTLSKDGIDTVYDVILGKKTTPTPAFETTFSTIDINPVWHPTAKSIHEMRKHPEIIKHYGVVFDSDKVYAPPGVKNPLGKARLNLLYSIKVIRIHGTSQPELFDTAGRNYSSGCVRVLHIKELVEQLTNDNIDWEHSYTIKLNEVVHVSVR